MTSRFIKVALVMSFVLNPMAAWSSTDRVTTVTIEEVALEIPKVRKNFHSNEAKHQIIEKFKNLSVQEQQQVLKSLEDSQTQLRAHIDETQMHLDLAEKYMNKMGFTTYAIPISIGMGFLIAVAGATFIDDYLAYSKKSFLQKYPNLVKKQIRLINSTTGAGGVVMMFGTYIMMTGLMAIGAVGNNVSLTAKEIPKIKESLKNLQSDLDEELQFMRLLSEYAKTN